MSTSYSLEQWLFIFYFYSFLGWCFESTVVTLHQRPPKWVNRGFMHGPFLPLYGSGAVMMLVVSAPFRQNLILIYFAGFLGATVLEYMTGVLMESLFKIRYWDYSEQHFNIQGYVCLKSSLIWGLLTIIMTKVLHPAMDVLLTSFQVEILKYLVIVLTIYIVADFSLSFHAAMDLRDILVKLEKLKEEVYRLQSRMDGVSEMLNESASQVKVSAGQYLDAVQGSFGSRIDAMQEGVGSRIDAVQEGMGNRIGAVQEGMGNRIGAVQEGLGNRLEAVQESLSNKLDYMSEKMEEKMVSLKGLFYTKPEDNLEKVQKESISVRDKIIEMKAKLTELTDIRDRFKRRMILGNPSMRSVKFKNSLEELKKTVMEKTGKNAKKEQPSEKNDTDIDAGELKK